MQIILRVVRTASLENLKMYIQFFMKTLTYCRSDGCGQCQNTTTDEYLIFTSEYELEVQLEVFLSLSTNPTTTTITCLPALFIIVLVVRVCAEALVTSDCCITRDEILSQP